MNLTKFDKPIVDVFTDTSAFLLSIIGGIALLVLVIGGILYIFASGNPEAQTKAKKTITYAVFGIILALTSYAIINQTSKTITDKALTALPTCYWSCDNWSTCLAGNQTRVCLESCGSLVNSPTITRSCIVPPASFDWSHEILPAADPVGGEKWMTVVKNQGTCGSCWAFATLGHMEAIYNIENNNATLDKDFSEQDLISCSTTGNCSGGSPAGTTDYIQNTGVVPQACFLYSESNETCTVPNKCVTWATQLWKIDSWFVSSINNQLSIKNELVNGGPVSASMNMPTWNAGTLSCTSATENHAVVIVGYDDFGGYWIVRNSWGTGWIDGVEGYFKVKYGECGLESGMTVGIENVTSP